MIIESLKPRETPDERQARLGSERLRLLTEPVHFSNLKKMAKSPAHYRSAVVSQFEPTRPMRVGVCAHAAVLGPHSKRPLFVYDGERKGNAWKDWALEKKAAHQKAELVTIAEWADAQDMAYALMEDPVAGPMLRGARSEVPLRWSDAGIDCETDGVDVLGDGWFADLKFVTTSEPAAFGRHAARLEYHAQMAWCKNACESNKINVSNGVFLIAIETEAPHVVTVHRMTEPTLEVGWRAVSLWMERLRVARNNDFYPGYAQSVLDFELPPWLMGEEDE